MSIYWGALRYGHLLPTKKEPKYLDGKAVKAEADEPWEYKLYGIKMGMAFIGLIRRVK